MRAEIDRLKHQAAMSDALNQRLITNYGLTTPGHAAVTALLATPALPPGTLPP